jgi:hypothetical protein
LGGIPLSGTDLEGADLRGWELQGANLENSQLQGADLSGAQLEGANLSGAQLQGANLRETQLQGADLSSAQLQGADLSGAQLQGANLTGAETTDSEFNETFVFRTDRTDVDLTMSAIRWVQAGEVQSPRQFSMFTREILALSRVFHIHGGQRFYGGVRFTPADIDKWKAAATKFVDDTDKEDINKRFERLSPNFKTAEEDSADQEEWRELEKQSTKDDPDGAKHRRRLAAILGDLACDLHGAPYWSAR